MLTVEFKDEGKLLAHLTANLKGELMDGQKEYHYEYYKVGGKVKKGISISSKGRDSLEQLALDIISEEGLSNS